MSKRTRTSAQEDPVGEGDIANEQQNGNEPYIEKRRRTESFCAEKHENEEELLTNTVRS